MELKPWTFCYGNGCADGMPPEDPHEVGSPEEVVINFPLQGWTFDASFETADKDCGREFSTRAEPLEDGRFVLRPAGYAGTYDVTLFGRGPGGDLFVTFRWATPSDGPLPEPQASLAVLADHDGKLDSYGVELMLSDLAEQPKNASATITVRAENGDKVAFDAKRARGCWVEGTVYWDGPDNEGLAAAQLPGESFTYEVEVMLDAERYVATATWPDDVIQGNEPSVRLDFEPDLPALQP